MDTTAPVSMATLVKLNAQQRAYTEFEMAELKAEILKNRSRADDYSDAGNKWGMRLKIVAMVVVAGVMFVQPIVGGGILVGIVAQTVPAIVAEFLADRKPEIPS